MKPDLKYIVIKFILFNNIILQSLLSKTLVFIFFLSERREKRDKQLIPLDASCWLLMMGFSFSLLFSSSCCWLVVVLFDNKVSLRGSYSFFYCWLVFSLLRKSNRLKLMSLLYDKNRSSNQSKALKREKKLIVYHVIKLKIFWLSFLQ